MDFKGKTVVITGASSGIGQALCFHFAQLGANVVMGARNQEQMAQIAAQIAASGGKAIYRTTDVTQQQECKALIDMAVDSFDGIDVMICNAGISMRALFEDVDMSVLHKLMDVNFWGTAYCTKYALPHLLRSQGSLVGVSSVAGIHGLPARTGYSASKFAMTGFLETIRIENLHKGVHVMVACPGFTASNVRLAALTADGNTQGESPRAEDKMMSAKEVAERIAKGIAARKRTLLMEFNGRATTIIKKIWPTLLDRLFFNHMAAEADSPLRSK